MRIETRALLDLLTDLLATVEPKSRAAVVELHTCRGHFGDEPGELDLLAGASTTGYAAGHTYTSCDGQIPGWPMLLGQHDAKAIGDVFKEAAKKTDPMHIVELRRDGQVLHVREDPNLIDDGLSLSFALAEPKRFPWSVYRLLDREQLAAVEGGDGATVEAIPRTDLTRATLEPFMKVAKRRGDYLRVYRTHQDQHVLVQIGDTYRGALIPVRRIPDRPYEGDPQRPDADLHAPDLTAMPEPEPDDAEPDGETDDARDAEPDLFSDDPDGQPTGVMSIGPTADDLAHAARLVIEAQFGSVSFVQRKLHVGLARAQRLLVELEDAGIVGPHQGSKAREVLVAAEDVEAAVATLAGRGENAGAEA